MRTRKIRGGIEFPRDMIFTTILRTGRCLLVVLSLFTIALIANSQARKSLNVYSDLPPKDLSAKLPTFVEDGPVLTISLNRKDKEAYAVTGSPDSRRICDSELGDFIGQKLRDNGREPLSGIWLYDSQTAILRFGRYDYIPLNTIPTVLRKQLTQAQDEVKANPALSIGDIAFTAGGGWIFPIVGSKQQCFSDRAPQELVTACAEYIRVDHIVIGRSDAWVLVHDQYDFRTGGAVPEKLLTTLSSLKRDRASIQAIALSPNTNGWIIVANRQ